MSSSPSFHVARQERLSSSSAASSNGGIGGQPRLVNPALQHWRQWRESALAGETKSSRTRRSSLRYSVDLTRAVDFQPTLSSTFREESARHASLYWRDLLCDVVPCQFPLPYASGMDTATTSSFQIEDTRELYAACLQASVTLPTLLQAAWAMTLATYCVLDDVCFAYAARGRDVPIEGTFLTTLIRRIRVDKRLSKAQYMREVHDSYLEAALNQHCSQAELEEAAERKINALCNAVLNVRTETQADDSASADAPHGVSLSVTQGRG
ncbi:hypothetical protein MRB53_037829 [Persea americana]|nr:hypothetical protein MRB53_037829 [Persea americana]